MSYYKVTLHSTLEILESPDLGDSNEKKTPMLALMIGMRKNTPYVFEFSSF